MSTGSNNGSTESFAAARFLVWMAPNLHLDSFNARR
jgi:hypothetical protein